MNKIEEYYRFIIDAYTPDTLPMGRFAEYLDGLARMLGETDSVHFVRLEPSSTAIVHKIDAEAAPAVRDRLERVKHGQGTVEEMDSYRRINTMLRNDNATGTLKQSDNAEIIRFPGRNDDQIRPTAMKIKQYGKIEGEVIRIGGNENDVPVILLVEGKHISGCRAMRSIAKELAKNLFEPVRLHGEGRWARNEDGVWELERFEVKSFDVLEESTLTQTVNALRGLRGDWGEDAINDLLRLRHSGEGVI